MVEKEWFGCFVSWMHGLWLKIWMTQAKFPTAISYKRGLLSPIYHIHPLHSPPKSYIGSIKMNLMVEKEWFGCFVSWMHGLWLKIWMNQAKFFTAISHKRGLLSPIYPIHPLHSHPKSYIGCIKMNCDG